VKRKKYGFTILEILTVMVVITILVGVLIPALTMVHKIAKETQQKAQLSEINLALEAFKGDYGDYPPSDFLNSADVDYCGAQMLSEALVGWDLMGFHPDSEWNGDGEDNGGTEIYPQPLDQDDPCDIKNLKERRGPYLELATTKVFKVGRDMVSMDGLFEDTLVLNRDTYVICDVYSFKKVRLPDGSIVKAGTPILYYRANTSSKRMDETNWDDNIYNAYDNYVLVKVAMDEKNLTAEEESLTIADMSMNFRNFRDFVTDRKATTPTMIWPYRPDSYILITAGADGLYGTDDDICNF
jgi:prepilin-type N-terminal cleavage/methylation domain-containing protein